MSERSVPLCVDLDRTVTPVSTLLEQALSFIKQSPISFFSLVSWTCRGKAYLRSKLSEYSDYDVSNVPLRTEVVEWLRVQHSSGRKLVLATAADLKTATEFADRLQIFDEIIAGAGPEHLRGSTKARVLVERFGEHDFDYVGASREDDTWKASRRAIVVGNQTLIEGVGRQAQLERSFPTAAASTRTWIKALRLHQWAKNALVFVPAVLAHSILHPYVLESALVGFLAFGLCASSAYVLNDLLDLASDRVHLTKRNRPFAAGHLSALTGLCVSALLLLAAAALATTLNLKFASVLAAYYVLTLAYSIRLKRVALLDVMILAALYAIRIIAGAAATNIALSFWLLAFSVFIFISLGFVKRYAELDATRRAARSAPAGRGYGPDDLPLIMSFGTSAGYCAIVVIALYVYSVDSQALYRHHKPLWLICPLMLFWISRLWTVTSRGQMHDDPVVFALRDSVSLIVLGALGLIILASI